MLNVIALSIAAALFLTSSMKDTSIDLPRTWYGPVTVTFRVQFTGNPYDPAENDCRVLFSDKKGHSYERIAYYDNGNWKATLVAEEKGQYTAKLIRNGEVALEPSDPKLIELDTPLAKGYIRIDTSSSNRFRWDSGERFYPVGHNLGWPSGLMTLEQHLTKMKELGLTWARIWACAWSNYNPWWCNDGTVPEGQMWATALDNWGKTLGMCRDSDVNIQMVLFHHGAFSSTTNSNWSDHPWNVAKGGFLKSPEEFFTNPEAEKRTKMWLRYAVARWAHLPNIMAWELFNEVEWTDGYKKDLPSVVAWHNKMADYIRIIDPYRHLITTSSSLEHPEMYASMDYLQPHTYPVDLTSTISTAKMPVKKPFFFGEFGLVDDTEGSAKMALRDGLFAGMLSNHAAAGMYWSWDRVAKLQLFDTLKAAADVIKTSGIADRPNAKPVRIATDTVKQGILTIRPGQGWAKNELAKLNIPGDATTENFAKMSGFMQSQTSYHKEMFPDPLELHFTTQEAGTVGLHLAGVSKSGAHVRLSLDGKVAKEYRSEPNDKDRPIDEWLRAEFKAGKHVVKIDNTGTDWAVYDKIELSSFGSQAQALALSESDWMLTRIVCSANAVFPLQVKVSKLILADGDYEMTAWNLDSGEKKVETVKVKDFAIVGGLTMPGPDTVVFARRK